MSMTARHESRKARQACQHCRERKARYQYRGEVRADRNHTLCFACYRSERERQRAQGLAQVDPQVQRSLVPVRSSPLSEREIAHRRRMMAHLERSQVEHLAGAARAIVADSR